MNTYIPADKLIAEIKRYKNKADERLKIKGRTFGEEQKDLALQNLCGNLLHFITSLQQEQPANMIQWTGQNLREVVSFTGKNPKFDEYFKSWEEFEQYVHAHNDIFKLFYEDGSHYEVPVGAWIVKTPDGYNVPSVARFVHARKEEQPEVDLEKDIDAFFDKWDKNSNGCIFDENGARVTIETIKGIVKRFLNARKEE